MAAKPTDRTGQPRIVNIYNFIRNSDFRLQNSEDILFDCTRGANSCFNCILPPPNGDERGEYKTSRVL